jgi:hypothetical protein
MPPDAGRADRQTTQIESRPRAARSRTRDAGALAHAGPLALFAALAVGWTWPLARHLGDAIPGDGGDNYSFLWNLWWMRHVLATPGLEFFRTTYLFYPFGTTIADHPHTALPALVAATVLGRASIVTAQNLILLAYVFLNMTSMYALVWDITRHRRAAVFAGVMFGTSPYLAAHLLGHFDLVAAWVLPAFALLWRRALASESNLAAIGAGAVLAATAYTAYYYVVYLGFFAAVYLGAWLDGVGISASPRSQTPPTRRLRWTLAGAIGLFAAGALWIVATGGGTIQLGPIAVPAHTPQNVLTAIWLCAIGCLLSWWRVSVTRRPIPADRLRRAPVVVSQVAGIFLVGATPLLWQAAQLVARGEYVTPAYQWRSAPRGVDLIAPLLGPPQHPLLRAASRAYASAGLDRIEAVAWIGVVPLLLLWRSIARRTHVSPDLHIWRIVAVAFALWALGPILTIAGFDTGLKLPPTLLRYVPFVANARMPGRAMVGVFMALAVLVGAELSSASGWWRKPAAQWLLIALVAFEYWDAPIALTPLDRPAVYEALAGAPPGAVCQAPFGIGDGLSVGVGSQDRSVLYYATVHAHPLVGGYIGRMPADAAERYASNSLTAALLRLSGGANAPPADVPSGQPPCRYLVLDRAASSAALRSYVEQLPADRIAADERRDLYRLR